MSESPIMNVSEYWVNILERDGWIVVNVGDRKLGILISITEAGSQYLRIAGFHLGESMFIGERKNVLSVKVERIPADRHNEMLRAFKMPCRLSFAGCRLCFSDCNKKELFSIWLKN